MAVALDECTSPLRQQISTVVRTEGNLHLPIEHFTAISEGIRTDVVLSGSQMQRKLTSSQASSI